MSIRHEPNCQTCAGVLALVKSGVFEGLTPTYKELADELGPSITTLVYHLDILKEQGRITQRTHNGRTLPRSLRVIE